MTYTWQKMRVEYEGPRGKEIVTVLEDSLVWRVLQGSTIVFTTIDRHGNTYTYRRIDDEEAER